MDEFVNALAAVNRGASEAADWGCGALCGSALPPNGL
jgi:hypothetical protein